MKAVIDRAKSFIAVLEASRRWSRSTARSLADFLRPELAAGEEMPDLVLLQQLFARALARCWRLVTEADEAHVAARGRRRESLAELDRRIRALYREVADLRSVLAGVFGAAAARHLISFSGATSRDPVVLLRQANRIAARLRDRSRPLPPASFEPSEEQRDRWAAPVEAAARDLQAANDRASVAGRELEAAKVELRQTLGDWNPCFVRAAGWLAGTYRAAGHDEREKAVRPSMQRPGRLLEEVKASSRPQPAKKAETGRGRGSAVRPRLLDFAPLGRVRRLLSGRSAGDATPRVRATS
jgi:hypothetical protein